MVLRRMDNVDEYQDHDDDADVAVSRASWFLCAHAGQVRQGAGRMRPIPTVARALPQRPHGSSLPPEAGPRNRLPHNVEGSWQGTIHHGFIHVTPRPSP